jgi:RNA polymerase sigma factor (sigma-70 family)
MEAARALPALPAQLRTRSFERECEQLRPLGVAYVLRRFSGSLNEADAEDAVADVLIRLHRRMADGRPPDNLRAAFFTSCRNAAIDQLRSRTAKPTVALEVVAEAPAPELTPEDRAESIDDATRLREALGRTRPNYREAIVLRFGLGLTVPEIATRLQISLPAAKKLVLRATGQIRERMESIEGAEFCPEMREQAERSLFDREALGLADQTEHRVVQAHFEHCGPCRSFLTALHENLHELGSTALLTGFAAEHSGSTRHIDVWLEHLTHAAHTGMAKLRLTAYKTTGAFAPDGSGAAPAIIGTSQKIAALCTAGAATATCLATGIIGPGVGVLAQSGPPSRHAQPPAQVRSEPSHPPTLKPGIVGTSPSPVSTPPPSTHARSVAKVQQRRRSPEPRAAAAASNQVEAEFGIEGESEASTSSATSSSSSATASSAESAPATSAPSSSSTSASPAAGTEKFGFGG